MDNSVIGIVGIVLLITFVAWFIYIIYYAIALYGLNPFKNAKALSVDELAFIRKKIPSFTYLSHEEQKKFAKRLSWFRTYKKFVFYGKHRDKERIKLLLGASAVLISLGLIDYKFSGSLWRIIVYPSAYFSKINRRHHFGEYNPRLRSLVFAADQVEKGFEITDDNINLAVHEFAHALSFHLLGKQTWEARRFRYGIRYLKKSFAEPSFLAHISSKSYFRAYGKTNVHEFFAVATENFVETPKIFKKEFPQLYNILQKMLNFEFHEPMPKRKSES